MADGDYKTVSARGLDLIRGASPFSATYVVDAGGRPVIGYGHHMRPSDRVVPPISREFAEDLLLDDLSAVEVYLNGVLPHLSQCEFDAVASFAHDLGLGRFEDSTLFRKLKIGDRAGAADEFRVWVNVGGRRRTALVARRASERAVFLSKTP